MAVDCLDVVWVIRLFPNATVTFLRTDSLFIITDGPLLQLSPGGFDRL